LAQATRLIISQPVGALSSSSPHRQGGDFLDHASDSESQGYPMAIAGRPLPVLRTTACALDRAKTCPLASVEIPQPRRVTMTAACIGSSGGSVSAARMAGRGEVVVGSCSAATVAASAERNCCSGVQTWLAQQNYLSAPLSMAQLVLHHPHLASLGNLLHPGKLVALLRHCELGKLERFCDACPPSILKKSLPELLRRVGHKPLVKVLAPLLNNVALHESLAKFLKGVDARRISHIVNEVAPGRLDIVLRCPGDSLATLVCAVDDCRVPTMLLPLIHKPNSLLTLLMRSSDFDKLATVVNYIEPEVILWILGRVSAWRLVRILDSFTKQQLEPEGCFNVLLWHLQGDKHFTQEEVAPFLQLIDPDVVAQLVHGVPAHRLLKVLRHVGASGVARILENTNVDLIVRLWNGPLRRAVTLSAEPLSILQKSATVAAGIRQLSDQVELGLATYDNLRSGYSRGSQSTATSNRAGTLNGLVGGKSGTSDSGSGDRAGRGSAAAVRAVAVSVL